MEVQVLDKGFVCLEASHAHDLDVVNAARVSFHKHTDAMGEGDAKLIGFLMRNGHGTPFEATYFRFRVKAPIFVLRQWMKNRVGVSYSEVSGRYSELAADFYIPEPENVRGQVGKAGAYKYFQAPAEDAEWFRSCLQDDCEIGVVRYRAALGRGIAKELARLFLHVNTYSEIIWTVNARSLMTWLSKRGASDTQWEHSQYAPVVEAMFAETMPITAAAFVEHGRQAP